MNFLASIEAKIALTMVLAAAILGCDPPRAPRSTQELTPAGTPLTWTSDLSSTEPTPGPVVPPGYDTRIDIYTVIRRDRLAQTLDNSPATRRELKEAEKKAIEKSVGEHLKDPFSAHYEWPEYTGGSNSGTYCGYVNAKNLYGAYVGVVEYYVEFTKLKKGGAYVLFGRIADVDDPSSDDSKIVEIMCANPLRG